ncbi:MAG: site-specific DNA-methyltransferase [Treponema sp.]|nr:site-specific DNA-methyltransferase [Treponema sp.]
MSPETEQQYKNQIAALKAELEKLKNQKTQEIRRQQYGLNWIDVPEVFEKEAENKIPVLIEDKSKAIKNEDGKPTHILIEGDNYHALTCLNYTHAGKIDVIYIDPPYNTGSDGFTYKDARFLDKFPNGKPVPKDDPLRHSTWLSFMDKRLRLAKNLLSDKGVIFISIDDNEQANLKLLCDQIFGEKNFVGTLTWESTTQPINTGTAKFQLQQKVEYIFCYAKNKKKKQQFILNEIVKENKYPHVGKFGKCRFEIIEKSDAGSYKRETMKFQILGQCPREGKRWQIGEITARDLERRGRLEIVDGIVKKAIYPEDELVESSFVPFWSHYSSDEVGTAQNGKDELNEIIGYASGFDTVKTVPLLSELFTHFPSKIIILDFFAGSGTTLHATMKLNAEDGGNRQCILVQQQENDANICETITYERNRRVIQGYTNAKNEEVAGLGNSLKYYKTDFIGENNAEKAGDEDKITLAQKAGYLISLVENTLEEIEINDFYQIFSDAEEKLCTAIYFNGDTEKFPEFVHKIQEKNKKTTVYIFTWGSPDIFENEFDDLTNITIKSIPQPILEIYKSLMKNGEQ